MMSVEASARGNEAAWIGQQTHEGLPRVRPVSPNLPPSVRVPKFFQAIAFSVPESRPWTIDKIVRRYGKAFTLDIPVFGKTVILADPALTKQLFTTSNEDLINIQPNLSRVLGPGSSFAMEGVDHRNRRC